MEEYYKIIKLLRKKENTEMRKYFEKKNIKIKEKKFKDNSHTLIHINRVRLFAAYSLF